MRLVVIAGRQRGKVFDLGRGRHILGRADDSDIQIADITVSRRHAQIDIDEDDVVQVRDLRSANGTSIDGRETKRGVIKDGGILKTGDTELALALAPDQSHTTTLKVGDTDMTEFLTGLIFCSRCNESIPAADIDEGRAALIEGDYLCSICLRKASGDSNG